MTESTVSGRRRRSRKRYRRIIDSVIQTLFLTPRQASDLSRGHGIFRILNQRDFLWGLLAVCGVVAPIIFIVLAFVGAAVTSGYSHVSDPISQLAALGSPHPGWMTTGFITYGIMILGFGFALYRSVREHRFAWLVLLFYFLHGIGFLLGGVFSDDSRAVESIRTTSGSLHNVGIIIGCSSFEGGMFVFAWLKRNDPTWRIIARIFMVLLIIILLIYIVNQIPAVAAAAEGLVQRVFGFLAIVLIEMAAIRLLVSLKRWRVESSTQLH